MDANELLKRGVPVSASSTLIMIDIEELLTALKNPNVESAINEAQSKFYNVVVNRFGSEIADLLQVKNYSFIQVITNSNTLEKKLIISPYVILGEIYSLFDWKYTYMEFSSLVQELYNMNEKDMKDKYPELYDFYNMFNVSLDNLKEAKAYMQGMNYVKKMQTNSIIAKQSDVHPKTVELWMKECDVNDRLKLFKRKFITIIETVLKNIKSFDAIISDYNNEETVDVNLNLEGRDVDRFEMLIAYEHLKEIKDCEPERQQAYIYYLSDFFANRMDLVDNNRRVMLIDGAVYVKDMYEEYKRILDEFIEEYLRTFEVNWDIFSGTNIDSSIIEKIKQKYGERLNNNAAGLTVEQLIDLFIKKKEFFDKTDPYYRILGKNAFDGYVGYIYKNGLVVLEKFFENSETGRIASETAIYAMNLKEFQHLTQLSKNQIIANNLCKRFIHKGDWQSRVRDYISSYKSDVDVPQEVSSLKQ